MFWYLASPYSRYPEGIDEAYRVACRAAGKLIKAGIPIFCPIAHSHPITIHGGVDPFAHDTWMALDRPFMEAARGLIVLRAWLWDQSRGVQMEIDAFREMKKPILYMDPYEVPKEIGGDRGR